MVARPRILQRRDLNRALLARQLLLKRHRMAVPAALEHLVGMQAQAPDLPYVGLWSRLADFDTDHLSRLVAGRKAVRISLMRNTIHLVTSRDAHGLKPLFAPLGERGYLRGSPWGRDMKNADLAAIRRAGHEIMNEQPRTVAELARLLSRRFPEHDGFAMAYGVRYMVPLVFTTPRGIWGAGGPVALTTLDAWLGSAPGPASTPDDLVTRYLAAYGPASAADMRAWSGLSLRPIFERLRPGLKTFRDENGGELFDVPGAPRPSGERKVPVRFLPDYDNILQAHADRTRIMAPGQHLGLFSSNGIMKGSVLVDGFVRASWIPVKTKGMTALSVTPFESPLDSSGRSAVAEEGLRLLDLLAPGDRHQVEFCPVKR